MEFETVFDLSNAGFKLQAPQGIAFSCILFGGLMWLVPRLYVALVGLHTLQSPTRRFVQISGIVLASIATPAFAYLLIDSYRSYEELMDALRTGRYESVEGPVVKFETKSRGLQEGFEVKGVRFDYTGMNNAHGFKRTARNGGPMREGLYIRIAYVGKEILRLEVRK